MGGDMASYQVRRQRLLVAALALAAFPLAAGIARATIPDAQGVIHGCVRNGDLRVIDTASAACKDNETALVWNQQGPKGDTGDTGAQGVAGPPGSPATVEAFA